MFLELMKLPLSRSAGLQILKTSKLAFVIFCQNLSLWGCNSKALCYCGCNTSVEVQQFICKKYYLFIKNVNFLPKMDKLYLALRYV